MSEFEDERKKIKETILDLSRILGRLNIRIEPILAEDFSAKSESPLDVCISKVKDCDIFVCLIGKKYGNTVKDGLSPTHIEYRTAYDEWMKSGKEKPEILIYIRDIDEKKDVRETKVEYFIKEIRNRHYYRRFKDSEDLISKIKEDLIHVIFEKHVGGEKEFKLTFRKKLENYIKTLEETKGYFEEEMDNLIALIKREIDNWSISNVRFAIQELFLRLYKYEGILLHSILEDLYLRAYNQRLRLFDSMVYIFQELWVKNWISKYDIELFEKIADVLLRLGVKFLDIDIRATRTFIGVIDDMAGDVFEKEVLSRLVIFGAILLDKIGRDSEKMDLFIDLLGSIETNDEYAWEAEYYSYLIDSVEYAYQIQDDYGVRIDSFVNSFIKPMISRIKDRKLNDFVECLKDSIEEELHGEEDFIDYDTEYLVRLILSYKKAFQDIADQIKQKIYETNDKRIIDRLNKLILRSSYLKKLYRGGNMITTVNDFIKFLKENSDLSKLVGIEAWGHAFVTFERKLTENDKRKLGNLAKEYELTNLDFEIENEFEITFLVDKVVGKESNIDRLVDFIQKLNEISKIKKISIDLSFKFE